MYVYISLETHTSFLTKEVLWMEKVYKSGFEHTERQKTFKARAKVPHFTHIWECGLNKVPSNKSKEQDTCRNVMYLTHTVYNSRSKTHTDNKFRGNSLLHNLCDKWSLQSWQADPRFCLHLSLEIPFLVSQQQFTYEKQF